MTNYTSKKEMQKLKKQLETKLVKIVEENPFLIKDIYKPTKLVRNYAVAGFLHKYLHEKYSHISKVIAKDKILDIKQKEEEVMLEILTKDPIKIKEVPNPSRLARNYAIASFLKKYSRER